MQHTEKAAENKIDRGSPCCCIAPGGRFELMPIAFALLAFMGV